MSYEEWKSKVEAYRAEHWPASSSDTVPESDMQRLYGKGVSVERACESFEFYWADAFIVEL